MSDFLQPLDPSAPALPWQHVVLRLIIAALLGAVVAWVYRRTRGQPGLAGSFPTTLVLLSVLIAMVTQTVGRNVALAFSLVGALSIVRFRTVVRDTQDTAFVIFAVAVGMAVGTNYFTVAFSGLVVAALTAFIMRERLAPDATRDTFVLRVRVGLGHDATTLIGGTLDRFLSTRRVLSMATAQQGMSIDISYETRLRRDASPDELVKSLNRLDGVQSVELQRRVLDEEGTG